MSEAFRPRLTWRSGALLLAGGLVLAFVMLEGLLRIAAGSLPPELRSIVEATPSHYGVYNPYIGHLHRANTTIALAGRDFETHPRTDANGFRNREPWPERADIVVVGDSLVFGYGVADDEAWPSRLAAAMPQTRIVNLGLIGGGPQQYLRVLETFGLPLRPRLVVVGLFPQNDFWDARLFERWLHSDEPSWNYMVWRDFGQPNVSDHSPPGTKRLRALVREGYVVARYSYVFNLAERTARSVLRGQGRGRVTLELADGALLQLFPRDFKLKTAGAQAGRPELAAVIDSVKRLRDTAAAHGAQTVVVLQPSKEETYLQFTSYTAADPTVALRPALDRLGIPWVELAPVFRAEARGGARLFFEVDGHPNRTGHALIATELLRSKLLDQR